MEAYAALAPEARAREALQERYFRALELWTEESVDDGTLFRWVANAEALALVKVKGVAQDWATALLGKQLDWLRFDKGPHTLTRVVLRYRLWQMAKQPAHAAAPIRTLRWMGEQGVLMALADEPGDVGRLAAAALDEFLDPAATASKIIDVGDP